MIIIILILLSLTNTKNSTFFEISYFEDNPIFLVWGKDDFKDSIPVGTDKIRKLHSDENHLLVQVSCGSPCWYLLILPLSNNDTLKSIQYNYCLDTNNKLVLGSSENLSYLKILNYNNCKTDSIKIPNCKYAFNGYCLTDAWFSNDSIYVEWNDSLISKKINKDLF